MPDLAAALTDLKRALGDYLERNREDGVFHAQIGGPGSIPALAALDVPELQLDLLPETPTAAQRQHLAQLGYVPDGEHWLHPGGWRLVFCDHGTGWRAEQHALRELLLNDAVTAQTYQNVFQLEGRAQADAALRDQAREYYAQTIGFRPAKFVAEVMAPLNALWMFAAGVALDLHLGRVARPHDDLDVVVPRERQHEVRQLLQGWRLDACLQGTYQVWDTLLEPPHHQIHARHSHLPAVIMADFMLTDLSGGLWHYRRDPSITLPLERARKTSANGLPYLTPEAVLLFKASTGSHGPRGKDWADFARVQPTLDAEARDWLRWALEKTAPGHPWLATLESASS